jgi:integrase/lambda repressor-like predicted transcriptional regulator
MTSEATLHVPSQPTLDDFETIRQFVEKYPWLFPQPARAMLTARQVTSQYLARKSQECAAGVYSARGCERATFYINSYLEWMAERADLPVNACRKSDLVSWVLSHPEWKSSNTRNDAIALVVSAFRWAEEEPIISRGDCPYRRPKRPPWAPPQPRAALTPDEFARIMAMAKSCDGKERRGHPSRHAFRRAFYALYQTGMRTCEMRTAQWEQVDWNRSQIVLTDHKTAKVTGCARRITLRKPMLAMLLKMAARIKGTPSGPIFLNGRGRRWTKDAFAKKFRKFADMAGVRKEVSAYSCRHAYTVRALNNNVGERQIADSLGQKSTKYVEHYGRSAKEDSDYLAKVAEQVNGGSTEGETVETSAGSFSFAQQVGALLHVKGMTHGDLAKTLGVAQGNVSRMLRRDRPKPETVVRIAKALGVELRDIWPGAEGGAA